MQDLGADSPPVVGTSEPVMQGKSNPDLGSLALEAKQRRQKAEQDKQLLQVCDSSQLHVLAVMASGIGSFCRNT